MTFKSDIIIGIEVHVQLDTDSKLFCGCPTQGSDEPNTRTCVTCLGHPGSKPVVNKKAVEYAIKMALATKSKISKELIFSRKSYFYPDMSKNFQISQYEIPLSTGGEIMLKTGKKIRLTRIHMEEDPAALVHPAGMQKSSFVLVDYNRSGNPLIEIVTEPDMGGPNEAREFMKQLINILNYLKIFDVEKCIIKADANISIKESDYTRVEIKNITGFKEIERALNYEVLRQKNEIGERRKIVPETRAWASEKGITFSLRQKEVEEEYGYIIEPDLTKIELKKEWIKKIAANMPELAHEKVNKFISTHNIKREDAEIIAAEKDMAELFEKVAEEIDPTLAAKWLRRELTRVLNYNKKTLKEVEIDEKHVIDLLSLVESKKITETTAQKLMEQLIEKPFDVNKYVKKKGLTAVSDKNAIEKFCKESVEENKAAIEDYKKGNEKALHFIVGAVMRKSKGKADPKEVNEIIKKLL